MGHFAALLKVPPGAGCPTSPPPCRRPCVHDYVYDGSMSSIYLSNENTGLALNPRHYMCYSDNDDSLRVFLQYNLLLQNGIG